MNDMLNRIVAGLLAAEGVLSAFHATSPDIIPAEVMVVVGVLVAFLGAFALKSH